MDEKEYEAWRARTNSHPETKRRGEKIVTKKEVVRLEKLSKYNKWRVMRDISIMIFVFVILLLFAVKVFYPDNYKDLVDISHVCEPQIAGDVITIINNATCECGANICPSFPSKIVIEMANVTT